MDKILLAKRHRAERNFQRIGRGAIAVALLALVLLLSTIIQRGWQEFVHVEIQLTLTFDQGTIQLDQKSLRHLDVSQQIKQSLLSHFQGVTDRRDVRQLTGLISSGASLEVRKALVKNSNKQIIITLWLPASDVVDRAIKSNVTTQTSELERKITNQQLDWLDQLKHSGLIRTHWNPYFFNDGDSREPELAGFMGSIVGSLFTLAVCLGCAFPIGVMAAIYLEEFAPVNRITKMIEITINNLAAIPSIVFGLLGLAVYINFLGVPRSASLAGGLTLALMILPTIIIATRAALEAVPPSIRDAARGLGATPLQIVLHHTLPLSIPGIMTGVILGLARAIGETAPLLMIGMVAFVVDLPRSPLDAATSMPVQIYLWSTSPEPSFAQKTAAGIMVLLTIITIMNSLAVYVRKRFEHRW